MTTQRALFPFARPAADRRVGQRGFSLVELMVAIAIALFISAGLTALYLSMKNSFNAQDQLAQLQDEERIAATMLTTTAQSAGYVPHASPGNTASTAFTASAAANPDGTTFAAGQFIIGKNGTGTASDTLNIRTQTSGTNDTTAGADTLMNCQGATATAATTWINSFSIDSSNNLSCAVNGNTAVPLAANVQSMKVLYGVDINGDGATDTYLNASQMTTALWSTVRSARVTLVFVVPATVSGAASTQSWTQTIRLMNNP